jgi:PQQ-dependent catabolism-associated CXXCW motif protein
MTPRVRAIVCWAAGLTASAASAQDSFEEQQQRPGSAEQQSAPRQQDYPPQQNYPPQQGNAQRPGTAQQQQSAGQAPDALMQVERQDFGVPAQSQLRSEPMHGPTPASIPGGQLITTRGLVELLQNQSMRALVFDVLGAPEMLPGAIPAVPAHQGGSFDDQTQAQFGQFLEQTTRSDKETPLVFYCQSVQCWMSYNAALRAIKLGYTNVLWYRGGLEAWKQAGQQVQSAQTGYSP